MLEHALRHPEENSLWVVERVLEYGDLEDIHIVAGFFGREVFFRNVSEARFSTERTRVFWEQVLTKEGIECTKRFSRKDFIDLYTILRGGSSLEGFFQRLGEKFGEGRVNSYHVLKSLTDFEDAEREPMPRMLEPFEWKESKSFFVREAHAIALP